MDSLTISPSILRRATMPDDLLLGDTMFEWDPQAAATTHSLMHGQLQQQTLSPPEMDMVMGSKMHQHAPTSHIHKTPVRQRASSMGRHQYPELYEEEKGFVDNKGLVTPISMAGTPASYWAGQKLEFMATPRTEHEYSPAYNTPLATPVPLVPRSPLFDKQSPVSGTNPFYNPPLCMRPSNTPTPLASPNLDLSDKVKAASAAEEALASFTEPNRDRALSESDASRPEKPFGCSHCTKTFRRMEHLRRHIKIHTKERPFSCEITGCGRKFSRNDNLKAHMKTHAKPTGRNIYVEGLEIQEVQATPKRRRVE